MRAYPRSGSLSLRIGGAVIMAIVGFAIMGPLISSHGPEATDMANRFAGPSATHWLGTDNFGRDLWVRMAFGARLSRLSADRACTRDHGRPWARTGESRGLSGRRLLG